MFNRILITVFALAFCIAYASEAQLVTDGLVSHWDFDNVVDGAVKDTVGNHDGTFVGDIAVVAGKFGDALEFAGADSYVEMADPDAFICNADFTWCAWIKTDAGGCIVAKTEPVVDSDVQGAKTFMVQDDVLTVDVGWVGQEGGTTIVNDGQWHYVAMTVTFNGDDTIQFYVDGEDAGQVSMNVDEFPEDGFVVTIGWDPRCGPEFPPFAGIIDEVSIYDRVLSQAEIQQNFAAEPSTVSPAEKLAGTWGEIKASR